MVLTFRNPGSAYGSSHLFDGAEGWMLRRYEAVILSSHLFVGISDIEEKSGEIGLTSLGLEVSSIRG